MQGRKQAQRLMLREPLLCTAVEPLLTLAHKMASTCSMMRAAHALYKENGSDNVTRVKTMHQTRSSNSSQQAAAAASI
eukprot:1156104-Pelagomonas_calceolata.AAC.5